MYCTHFSIDKRWGSRTAIDRRFDLRYEQQIISDCSWASRRLCCRLMYIIIFSSMWLTRFAVNLISDLMDFWCLSTAYSSLARAALIVFLLPYNIVVYRTYFLHRFENLDGASIAMVSWIEWLDGIETGTSLLLKIPRFQE